MTLLKLFLCLSFLVVVLSEDSVEEIESLRVTDVKFHSYIKKELSNLSEIAKKLYGSTDKQQVAVLNDYVDNVLINLNEFIREAGLDPISLPGFEENFKWTVFFGWVSLDDGWLRGLSTIERKGDVTIKYKYPNMKLHMVLGFSKLSFDYHYEAKFMGLGPSGSADGKSTGSKFTVDLNLNMVNLRAALDKFRLNSIGKLSLEFSGSAVGSIANVLIEVVIPILKPIITIVLNGFIKDGLQAMLDSYNGVICKVLADCPQQIMNTVYN